MSNNAYAVRKALPKRSALAVALAVGLGISGLAFGQQTTGTIFGSAPAGDTVLITGGAGFHRAITVGSNGRYTITLPVGTYTVSLKANGAVVETHKNVSPPIGAGTQVNFVAAQKLAAINVSANAIPAIDVSSTTEQTIINAQQLRQLPIGRSAASIAMLAPGVNLGQALVGTALTGQPLLSFGGDSTAENAYYINGMDVTNPVDAQGGLSLPYNSIAQQQTKIASYGPRYGRSTGGVINQVGRSGTNQWHFGGRILWQPAKLRGNETNSVFANPRVTAKGQQPGDLLDYQHQNQLWTTAYDLYVGGPIVKNKLFFFASGEWEKQKFNNVTDIGSGSKNEFFTNEMPKAYVKIDWNINDRNILSGTYLQSSYRQSGTNYAFDYPTLTTGSEVSRQNNINNKFKVMILHYTSYITDNLTLNAMYGKEDIFIRSISPNASPLPAILSPQFQDPDKNGHATGGIVNAQSIVHATNPKHRAEQSSKRLTLTYTLPHNTISVGMDNLVLKDNNDGSVSTGTGGFSWLYGQTPLGTPISVGAGPNGTGRNFVPPPPPSSKGFWVAQSIFRTGGSFFTKQRALWAQDKIQVTSNLLVDVGLRKDKFTNYNQAGIPFIKEHSGQLGPRLSASWDVFGDSTLKVFGNAGRYYLALPPSLALREVGVSTFSRQFFTYTSINSNGEPQDLTLIPGNGDHGFQGIYLNGENGEARNIHLVTAKNVKAEYQDNFSVGADWEFTQGWVAGLTLRYQDLGRTVDDVDTGVTTMAPRVQAAAAKAGITIADIAKIPAGPLVNPGGTELIPVLMNDGSVKYFPMDREQFGFPASPKRRYYAINLSLTHPFDGKWFGRISFLHSRSYGNTEGPIQSNIGQHGSSVSITEQWDFGQIMQYAGGEQANDRTNVIKSYGYYKFNPQWSASWNAFIASGTPESCLGFYGPKEENLNGYGDSLHFCGGVPTPPGSTGHTPWQYDLSLGLTYQPAWADHKLGFRAKVLNLINEQKVTQIYPFFGHTATPDSFYKSAEGFTAPREVVLSVFYNY